MTLCAPGDVVDVIRHTTISYHTVCRLYKYIHYKIDIPYQWYIILIHVTGNYYTFQRLRLLGGGSTVDIIPWSLNEGTRCEYISTGRDCDCD